MDELRRHWQAGVALLGAVVLWLARSADALPWPSPAGATLASLLALVAITRVTGELGVPLQRWLRYAIAGVAIAAGTWFATVSMTEQRPPLLLLGALHIVAAWLAAYGEPSAKIRRQGMLVLAGAMLALSTLALAAVSGNAYVPVFAATALVGAGILVIGFVWAPQPPTPRQ